ncbi:SDR family oxidoreductase [Paenibacillus thiaminolyticus]|nr:SDR family oxidoreductase [Paenibacillus thiaminolyticus]NGP57008.1 SDR family oxidoreductase [Paenibacillus thiaminolyticus]
MNMSQWFDLSGKTAVIAGGTSTLGRSMAEALAAHGAQVAIIGRKADATAEVVAQLAEAGGRAQAFLGDMTDERDIGRVHAEVMRRYGKVDVLLYCPGVNSATPFFELEMEEWDHIMNVNVKGAIRMCQQFGQSMIGGSRGGSIILISSVSSDPPLSRVFTYSMSKAALNSMTKYLAREFAPHGVRVNAIIPGFFPAEQNRAILSPERVEAIMRHTPMGRFGTPEELQGTAVWLASERASGFVTGALIRVDGGFGAMTI